MSKVNPYLDFLKTVENPRNALLVFDVDLAIQPSMSVKTTDEQKANMWELYERTDGGVIFFTGRTHQSVKETFGHDYAGVFEHYSMARFGHGQTVYSMAPALDVQQVGVLSSMGISASGIIRISDNPSDIRQSSDPAVYIEHKNSSVALVHTLRHGEDHADHLRLLRSVLQPVARDIVERMGLQETHEVKTGGDAVEIVPKGLDLRSAAIEHLPEGEINRIVKDGLSKATAIHNFHALYSERRMIMTGDSSPDLDAMVEGRKYGGKGVYVSNGMPLKARYLDAVHYKIDRHEMTWPIIADTVIRLREKSPIIILPSHGPSQHVI